MNDVQRGHKRSTATWYEAASRQAGISFRSISCLSYFCGVTKNGIDVRGESRLSQTKMRMVDRQGMRRYGDNEKVKILISKKQRQDDAACMRIIAVRPITPVLRLCYNCRHGGKPLSHPECATCRKYANWQEVWDDAKDRSLGDRPENDRSV